MRKLFVGAWEMFWDEAIKDTKLPVKIWCLVFLPVSYICILIALIIVYGLNPRRSRVK